MQNEEEGLGAHMNEVKRQGGGGSGLKERSRGCSDYPSAEVLNICKAKNLLCIVHVPSKSVTSVDIDIIDMMKNLFPFSWVFSLCCFDQSWTMGRSWWVGTLSTMDMIMPVLKTAATVVRQHSFKLLKNSNWNPKPLNAVRLSVGSLPIRLYHVRMHRF